MYSSPRFVSMEIEINGQPNKGWSVQRHNSLTKSIQKSSEFSSLLFKVTSTALPWDLYFFKLTQPLTVSTVQLLNTVKEKVGKPDRKPYPLPYGLRNPYRNLKSEKSQDYAQKPQRNCMFMNSASGKRQFKNLPFYKSFQNKGFAAKRSCTHCKKFGENFPYLCMSTI